MAGGHANGAEHDRFLESYHSLVEGEFERAKQGIEKLIPILLSSTAASALEVLPAMGISGWFGAAREHGQMYG